MRTPLFSIGEAVKVGWRKTFRNFWRFFLIVAAGWILSAIIKQFAKSAGNQYFLSTAIVILGSILFALITMGFLRATLNVLDDQAPSMNDFYASGPQFLNFIGATLVAWIIVGVGLIVLIIPGIILGLRLKFYPYFILEKNLGPVAALRASWNITRGQLWQLFLLAIVLGVIVVVGYILLGIGLVIAMPVAGVAMAFVYRKLRDAAPEAVPVHAHNAVHSAGV